MIHQSLLPLLFIFSNACFIGLIMSGQSVHTLDKSIALLLAGHWICDSQVGGSNPGWAPLHSDVEQASYTYLCNGGNSRPSKFSPDHRQTDVGRDEGIIQHPIRQLASGAVTSDVGLSMVGALDGRLLPPLHVLLSPSSIICYRPRGE